MMAEFIHRQLRLQAYQQVKEVSKSLNADPVPYGPSAMCFEPMDAIVFFDKNNKIIASVSICFTCCRTDIKPASLSKSVNYVELAKFFAPLKLKGGYNFEEGNPDLYIKHYFQRVEKWKQKVLDREKSNDR